MLYVILAFFMGLSYAAIKCYIGYH